MFKKDVYSGRRATLKKMISKGIAFFPANNEAPFNYPSNTYIYRQDSNFSYFFGLNHPDLVGIIDFESGEEILFGVDVTIDDVIWCGPLPSLKEQGDSIGITDCRDFNKFGEYIQQALAKGRQIHILPTYRADTKIQCSEWLNCHINKVQEFVSVELIKAVIAMREVKSDLEIAEMERAANTAYYMHTTAMKMCKPGMIEQEMAGVVEGLRRGGRPFAVGRRPCVVPCHFECGRPDLAQPRPPQRAERRPHDGLRLRCRNGELLRLRLHPHHTRGWRVQHAPARDL